MSKRLVQDVNKGIFLYSEQVALSCGRFAPRGHLATSVGIFTVAPEGSGAVVISGKEPRDGSKHPTTHRTASHNNYPALNVKGIEVEKSYSMPTHLRETHSARISKCFFMSVLH